MALREGQIKEIETAGEAFLKQRRPPVEMRNQLDLVYRIEGQSVIIYEIRPRWDNPTAYQEAPVAKTTYVNTQKVWKIYWMQSDLKWHSYTPNPTVKTIKAFFNLVDEDQNACFFG